MPAGYPKLKELIASKTVIPTLSYGRVSSEKQLSGEGLKRQREGTLAWIAKHPELHIRLDAELEDRARSAWRGDHVLKDDAALGKILQMVESGELRPPLLIIFEALDRFSRENHWVAHNRLSGLVAAGIFVATTSDDKIYNLDSDMADLIVSVVYLCAANKSSSDTSYRVRKTKLEHFQESMISGALIHANVPAWLAPPEKINATNRLTRKAPLIERHGETILRIYEMGLHHGSEWITRKLIADNIEPFGRTGKWSLRYVKYVLRSRAVLGHLESKHGIIENIYERIPGLTDELWLAVQAAQDQRRDAGSATPFQSNRVNLLAGIGQCAFCDGKMGLTENHRTHHRYYRCNTHAVLHTCDNRCRYRQDVIEAAMLDRFGMGWLEARPVKPPPDTKSLETQLAKLRDREKRLAGRLKELDNDEMFDVVMTQLRELRSEVSDAATRLQAARQQAALAQQSVKIKDMTDRAAIATALRQQLEAVRFLADNLVELESQSHILSVIARTNAEKPTLALKFKRDAPKRIIPASRQPVEIKWLRTKRL